MIHSDYLTGVFIPQVTQFDKMFSETVFPPFADPEAQANKVAQDYWDKKMSEPVGEFGPDEDPGDIADDAHQKSIDFYETMTAMHHTVVNLFTAGVFHLFEQQAGTLLQDWNGKRPKFPFDELGKLSVKDKAGNTVAFNSAPTWAKLDELRLVANVVKHAEGDFALSPLGRRIVAPTKEGDDFAAKREALLRPRVVRDFLTRYNGSRLPNAQIGGNVLEELGVPSDRSEEVYNFVVESARSVGFLRDLKGQLYVDLESAAPAPAPGDGAADGEREEESPKPPPDTSSGSPAKDRQETLAPIGAALQGGG